MWWSKWLYLLFDINTDVELIAVSSKKIVKMYISCSEAMGSRDIDKECKKVQEWGIRNTLILFQIK